MIKTKFKQLTVVLLVIVLSLAIALVAVACNKNTTSNDTTQEEESGSSTTTETLIITNGNFNKFTSGSAPYSVTSNNWSTRSISAAETVSGVIPLDEALYNESKSAWDSLAYPGNPNEDDKYALMVYNKQAGAYGYRHTSFSTTIGAFYKITVTFRVVAGEHTISADSGAYILFGNVMAQSFGPFGVTDGWETVTLYLQASQSEAQNVYIDLLLGNTGHVTEGYAFFHDVTATKISASEYNDADVSDASHSAKVSQLVADPEFDVTTGTSTVKTPAEWSGNFGEGNGSAPASGYNNNGIISVEENAFDAWKAAYTYAKETNPGKATATSSDNVLVISNEKALAASGGATNFEDAFTSYGYSSKSPLNVEPSTYYLLSVWVYTDLNDAETIRSQFEAAEGKEGMDSTIDHSTYGANIRLQGQSDVLFTNINTNKTWKKYTFVLIGNEYRAKQLTLSLWLGYGGSEDTTRASGTVYFDSISLENLGLIDDRDALIAYYQDPANFDQEYTKVVDVKALNGADMRDNLIDNANFEQVDADGNPTGWSLAPLNEVRGTDEDVKVELIDVDANADKDEAWWKENYGIDANPKAPYGLSPVLMINNVNPSAYEFKSEAQWEINPNLHYRLAVWVKTTNIASGKGINVYLKNAEDDSTLTSFSTINTASYENELTNDYVELVIYIQGSKMTSVDGNDKINVYLDVQFGSGNNYSTASFLSGQLFIANVNMEQVTYSEFNGASTGNYVKKYTATSSTGTLTNGNFNNFEYDEDKIDSTTGFATDLLKASDHTTDKVTDLKSGILNINDAALIGQLFGDNFKVYNDWDDSIVTDKPVDMGAPNVFVAMTEDYNGNDPKAIKAAKVLKSTSMSLSNNSYYIFKAYIRSVGTKAQIELSTTSNNSSPLVFTTNGNGNWEEVVFLIETGNFATASMNFVLYFGEYYTEDNGVMVHEDSDVETSGIVFLDSLTFYTISKTKYETDKDAAAAFDSYLTDTFDTTSTDVDTLSSPKLWTGSGSSSNANFGIYSKRYSTVELSLKEKQEVVDDEGNTTTNYVEIDGKTLTKAQVFDATGLDGDLGQSLLIINNQLDGYYQYALSSGITLAASSYYHFSLDARTFFLAQSKNAVIKLSNGTDDFTFSISFNSDSRIKIENNQYVTEDRAFVYEDVTNEWQSFHFYVATSSSSVSSVKLYLILGEEEAKVQGDALFDNVKLEKIDEDAFLAQYEQRYKLDANGKLILDEDGNRQDADESLAYLRNNRVVRLADEETQADEDDNDDDDNNNNNNDSNKGQKNNLLWLYISTIVIAAILIVVIIVFLVRRFAPKHKKKAVNNVSADKKDNKKQSKPQAKDDKFKD